MTGAAGPADVVHADDGHVTLHPLDLATARAVVALERTGHRWAADFPGEDDVFVASLLMAAAEGGHDGPAATADAPCEGPWLVAEDGLAVGTVGFKGPPHDGVVEIGYDLVPSARGRGLATTAVGTLLRLTPADVEVVRAETTVGNLASQRVLGRLGFTAAGTRHSPEDGDLVVWRLDR